MPDTSTPEPTEPIILHEVDDLDTTSALLGEHLGQIKAAVQDGQRIATLRHEALGMSVAVAFMDERG